MLFAKQLRAGVRSGDITCSIRIWHNPRVKVGHLYPMADGHILIESIERIELSEITGDLARRSGFLGIIDLLKTARPGGGTNVYLVEFEFVRRPDGPAAERQARRIDVRRTGSGSPPAAGA